MSTGVRPADTAQYHFIRWLGSGSYSSVWLASEKTSDPSAPERLYAIKIIPEDKLKSTREHIMQEIQLQAKLQHTNLVRLVSIYSTTTETERNLCIVLEYVPGGDLFSVLTRDHRALDETTALRLIRQLVAGLLYLSDHGIVHRDLKPANLMLSSTDIETATLKICDFGFAKQLQDGQLTETVVGTPYYLAPEVARSQPYSASADLWSVGCIIFELLTGRQAVPAVNLIDLMKQLLQPSFEVDFRPLLARRVTPQCLDVLRRLLVPNPTARMTIQQLAAHEWIAEPRPISMLAAQFGAVSSQPPPQPAASAAHPFFGGPIDLSSSSSSSSSSSPMLTGSSGSASGSRPIIFSTGPPNVSVDHLVIQSPQQLHHIPFQPSRSPPAGSPPSGRRLSPRAVPVKPFTATTHFPSPDSSYHRAMALSEVARSCTEQRLLGEALTLYLTGLQYLQEIIALEPDAEAQSPLSGLIERARKSKKELLASANVLFTAYQTHATGGVQGQINQQIFSYAMGLGRTGAVAEEMEMTHQASDHYRKGIVLFKHLLAVAPPQHSESLNRMIRRFTQRLESVPA